MLTLNDFRGNEIIGKTLMVEGQAWGIITGYRCMAGNLTQLLIDDIRIFNVNEEKIHKLALYLA